MANVDTVKQVTERSCRFYSELTQDGESYVEPSVVGCRGGGVWPNLIKKEAGVISPSLDADSAFSEFFRTFGIGLDPDLSQVFCDVEAVIPGTAPQNILVRKNTEGWGAGPIKAEQPTQNYGGSNAFGYDTFSITKGAKFKDLNIIMEDPKFFNRDFPQVMLGIRCFRRGIKASSAGKNWIKRREGWKIGQRFLVDGDLTNKIFPWKFAGLDRKVGWLLYEEEIVYQNFFWHLISDAIGDSIAEKFGIEDTKLNVIIVQGESVSSEELRRNKRLTAALKADDFTIFSAVSTVGENTRPNHTAMYTGDRYFETSEISLTRFDYGTRITLQEWAKANGYLTFYGADRFFRQEYYCTGGSLPWADYLFTEFLYARDQWNAEYFPYATRELIHSCDLVTGGSVSEEAADFAVDFLSLSTLQPKFGFFTLEWQGHERSTTQTLEEGVLTILTGSGNQKTRDAIMDKTVIIIWGDHGARVNEQEMLDKEAFWRLNALRKPMEITHEALAIRLPNRLRESHPHLQVILEGNVDQLVFPYDVFETVMDVIHERYPNRVDMGPIIGPSMIRFPAMDAAREDIYRYSTEPLDELYGDKSIVELEACLQERLRPVEPIFSESENWENFDLDIVKTLRAPKVPEIMNREIGIEFDKDSHRNIEARGGLNPNRKGFYHSWGDEGVSLFRRISHRRSCSGVKTYCGCRFQNSVLGFGPNEEFFIKSEQEARKSSEIAAEFLFEHPSYELWDKSARLRFHIPRSDEFWKLVSQVLSCEREHFDTTRFIPHILDVTSENGYLIMLVGPGFHGFLFEWTFDEERGWWQDKQPPLRIGDYGGTKRFCVTKTAIGL